MPFLVDFLSGFSFLLTASYSSSQFLSWSNWIKAKVKKDMIKVKEREIPSYYSLYL